MNINNEKSYHLISNISEDDLDDNNSLKKMLRLVGNNKRVIDFGCAVGDFAQMLTAKGCQVTGVEVNPQAAKVAEQYCEQVLVVDLDFVSLTEILPKQAFDVVVFGDVLEHLRDPWKLLEETRQLLKPEGYVVASIPNIAHGAIRLALLQGRFEYMTQGILDNTHLRFFTRKTVEELFARSGYFVNQMERTKIPVLSMSNLIPNIRKESFDLRILQEIEQDEDADTLQFIVRAFPSTLEGKYIALEGMHAVVEEKYAALEEKYAALEGKYTSLNQEYSEQADKFKFTHNQLEQIRIELEQSQTQLKDYKTEIERSQSQYRQKQVECDRLQEEVQQTEVELEQLQLKLQDTEANLAHSQLQQQQLQSQLQQAHVSWGSCQNIIQAMESSKFWKLRQRWLKLKSSLGFKVN
ncbi:MAG: methyltransferase domain-containing protein [Rhizonema sp. PD37]|nr:methyltransferase domain-containing protein [Rhizonema sp. PD37]